MRSGALQPELGSTAIAQFRNDFQRRFTIIDISSFVIDQAMDLAEKHTLRGYYAVQLAAAHGVARQYRSARLGFTIVSADDQLNSAAAAEGLLVENPNLHP